jgi:Lipocalin-like domain
MKKAFLLFIPLFLLFAHCKQEDNKPLLIGKWQGVSWKVNGKESGRDYKSVNFDFKMDDTYSTAFDTQLEKGTFRLAGDKLYTTGENKIEKMVKLSTLTADTMVMDMNRAGESEALILAKKH